MEMDNQQTLDYSRLWLRTNEGWFRGLWRTPIEHESLEGKPLTVASGNFELQPLQPGLAKDCTILVCMDKALESRGMGEAQHVPSEIRLRKSSCRE